MVTRSDSVVSTTPCKKPSHGEVPINAMKGANTPHKFNTGIINKSPATYATMGFCPDITRNAVERRYLK